MPLVMIVVALYLLVSAPMLGLVLLVHNLKSDYTRLFVTALILQIIPIGLIFFPLGLIGLGMLFVSLFLTVRRNRQYEALGAKNPEVSRRWTLEYQANLVAVGLALEQKGVAWLFLEVAAKHGLGFLLELAPATLVIGSVLGAFLLKSRQRRHKRKESV
jgi:hypothetical protein